MSASCRGPEKLDNSYREPPLPLKSFNAFKERYKPFNHESNLIGVELKLV